MCEWNGKEFRGVVIHCDPNAKGETWRAMARSKKGGGFHDCHAWASHFVEGPGRFFCEKAAIQINDIVNSYDDLDEWKVYRPVYISPGFE